MEQLTSFDYRSLLEFLGEIYASLKFDDFVSRLLSGLQQIVRADLIGVLENHPENGAAFYAFDPLGVATEKTHRTWEYVGHEHPVLAHYLQTRDSRFTMMSDFISRQKYHRLALYHELYRGMEVEDALVSFFPPSAGTLAAIALHRNRRTFHERDRLVLDLAGPHMMQAWRNAQAASLLSRQMESMSEVPKILNCGVVTLDPNDRLVEMSSSATAILERFFGPDPTQGNRLPAEIIRWVRQQKHQFAQRRLSHTFAPMFMEHSESRLVVRLLLGSDRHLLLLQTFGVDQERLKAFGLTRREAEVMTWVAKGKTNEEIGLVLAVSARTVQKHLEHIFTKLGVETRTAAAATVISDAAQR